MNAGKEYGSGAKPAAPPSARRLAPEEADVALGFVREIFMETVAPEYSAEGVAAFLAYADGERMAKEVEKGDTALWGCFEDGALSGVIGLARPSHLCLLFVAGNRRRRGLARALLGALAAECPPGDITVNASRYALEAYRKLGFAETEPERETNGIRYIPMRLAR